MADVGVLLLGSFYPRDTALCSSVVHTVSYPPPFVQLPAWRRVARPYWQVTLAIAVGLSPTLGDESSDESSFTEPISYFQFLGSERDDGRRPCRSTGTAITAAAAAAILVTTYAISVHRNRKPSRARRRAQVFSSCSYITPSVEAPEEGGAGLGAVARYVSEPRRK